MSRFMLSDAHTAQTSIKGKRIAITGGTTGIGRATAVLLASEGARVFVCGRSGDHLKDALERIGEVGEGDGISIDLAEEGAPDRFFAAAEEGLGGIDVAIINAAIPAEGLSTMDAGEVSYAVATNFTAYMMSAHAAQERMVAGDIILVGSTSAHDLAPASTVYAGIKAGIAGFSEALSRELGPKGIKVSLIEPGLTGSDLQYPDTPSEKQVEMINDGKMLRAEDIAVGIHYLLTQPGRTVVQQLVIVPRVREK